MRIRKDFPFRKEPLFRGSFLIRGSFQNRKSFRKDPLMSQMRDLLPPNPTQSHPHQPDPKKLMRKERIEKK